MGDVIMPDSSGRKFYTVWLHTDKVFFYLWYKIAWRHLVVVFLDFLILRRNVILGSVYKKKPGNWNSHNWSMSVYNLGCMELKIPSTELGFLNDFALRRKGEQVEWGWWEERRLELGKELYDITDAASTSPWYFFLKMLTYSRCSANIT